MKGNDESSLELLLDTMCNTFGGVIFITIALVVIISMTSALKQEKSDEEVTLRDVDTLKSVLAELQERLRQEDNQQVELEEQLKSAASDPRLRMLGEVAALEASVQRRELEAEVLRKSLENTRLESALVEKELQNAQDDLLRHSEEIEKDTLARQEMAAQLEALRQEQESAALNMVFTTLAGRKEMPYYLILQDGKLWRVGPEDEELLQTNADVDSRSGTMADGRIEVECTPKQSAGVQVFKEGALSPEFLQCLSSLPVNRVPCFWVPPESAEDFYGLREALKQLRKFHGFRLVVDKKSYGYSVVSGTKSKVYEY